MSKQQAPDSLEVFENIRRRVAARDLTPVYVLVGEESFFTDILQDHFTALVDESLRDFNLDVFYGTETPINRVLEAARSYPMMTDRRVVLVRQFLHQFDLRERPQDTDSAGNPIKTTAEESVQLLTAYLEQPNPSTVLVLIDTRTPNGNTRLGKALQSKAGNRITYGAFNALRENDMPGWIVRWTEHRHPGWSMEPDAAQRMSARMGPHPGAVSTELEKLCTLIRTPRAITTADVEANVPITREFSVFELKDAVLDRNQERAAFILEQMLRSSDSDLGEVFKTVGFFHSMFTNLWAIHGLRAKRVPDDQISGQLSLGGGYYFILKKDADRFRPHDWALVFEALHDADRAAKGFGNMDAAGILHMLLKRLIRA